MRWNAKRPGWNRVKGRRKARRSGDLTRYRSTNWKRSGGKRRGVVSFW